MKPLIENGVTYYPVRYARVDITLRPVCEGCELSPNGSGHPSSDEGSTCWRLDFNQDTEGRGCVDTIWQSGDAAYVKWAAERLKE